jgi:hypothetical protein
MAKGKFKSLAVKTIRANEGMANDILDLVFDNYFNGMSFEEALAAAQDELAAKAIERYGEKIRASLSRAGLEIDGVLSIESIEAAIVAKTGLEMDSLTHENILDAADKIAAKKISSLMGVEITSVLNGGLEVGVRGAVAAAIASGAAATVLMGGMSAVVRRSVTWIKAGVQKSEIQKIEAAIGQKKYRRKHKLVWD